MELKLDVLNVLRPKQRRIGTLAEFQDLRSQASFVQLPLMRPMKPTVQLFWFAAASIPPCSTAL